MKKDENKETESVASIIKKNFLQIAGLVVLVLNLWLADKLAPMAKDIVELRTQVFALESKVAAYEATSTQVTVDKTKIEGMEKDLTSIKNGITELNKKMDTHMYSHR